MQGLEGFAFAGEGGVGVILETTITEELKEEGFVREILSKIQNLRKESGFEVADKIKLYFAGNETLENVIKKFEDHIMKETLSRSEEHTSELQSRQYLVCRLLLEKKKTNTYNTV